MLLRGRQALGDRIRPEAALALEHLRGVGQQNIDHHSDAEIEPPGRVPGSVLSSDLARDFDQQAPGIAQHDGQAGYPAGDSASSGWEIEQRSGIL